jgi:predicted ribosome quality control (RQC) complex YloA/Tae2 family protein
MSNKMTKLKKIKKNYIIKNIDFSEYSLNINFYIGKNAYGNDEILEICKNNDIWFHVKDNHSSHVIASISDIPDKINDIIFEKIIEKGAILCKEHSKYKNDNNLEIIYTNIINIEKPKRCSQGTVIVLNSKIIII